MPFIVTHILNISDTELGWDSSAVKVIATKRGPSEIVTLKNDSFLTKEEAWECIKEDASQIDYGNSEVFFNGKKVFSFEEVVELIPLIDPTFIH